MVCFPPPSLLIGNIWVPVMNFVGVPYTKSALESGTEARIVQSNFSSAFDRVNHHGILYKLCSAGIECSLLSILTQLQHVMVECRQTG